MKTTRVLSVLLISIFLMTILTGIVAAQATTTGGFSGFIENIVNGIKGGGEPIFRALLGETAKNENFIIQILAFLLVVLVVYGVLGMVGIFGDKPWVNISIGIIVAILGTRFIPEDFLTQLATPSSAFVAILVLGLPFILLGFILQKVKSQIIRRAVWAAYGVIIFVLWMVNIDKPNVPALAKWLYPLILIGVGIAFAFDGTLQRWWGKAEAGRDIAHTANREEQILIGKVQQLQERLARAGPGTRKQVLKDLNDAKKALDDVRKSA